MSNSVYVAWQCPESRGWHVVGRLQEHQSGYAFNYTKGANEAKNFNPFSGMLELDKIYISEELFPLFKNRLLSSRRPEYPFFIKWLGLNNDNASPMEVLARSGGIRATDQLQVFKKIDPNENGKVEVYFFVHGIKHFSESAENRVNSLKRGDELRLLPDPQNEHDNYAIAVSAMNPMELIGYCPRFLNKDISLMLNDPLGAIKVTVEQLSEDAPTNYKLLCKLTGEASDSTLNEIKSNTAYMPIVEQ
ncbi:HIRAN domain [Providencia alcalifaciens]|nr:HIRAN domain-containing protein [Providencia alcalifaciens]SQI34796.1 HIRAN domain [Providencia alcalifaciens]